MTPTNNHCSRLDLNRKLQLVGYYFWQMNSLPNNITYEIALSNDKGMLAEREYYISSADGKRFIKGRLCVIKKDDEAIMKSEKVLKDRLRRNSYGGKVVAVKDDTRYLREYIIVFTTLSADKYNTKDILNLYRIRWQLELVFKRFKSLLSLGQLPKKTPESSEAWLYGKLFIALLIEKIIAKNGAFSPWRDRISGIKKQYVAYIRFCQACCPAINFTKRDLENTERLMG